MAVKVGNLTVPDWGLYAGGGLLIGGGYLLYRKRKAAASSGVAAPSFTPSMDTGSSGQQPSIVPYYLRGGSGDNTGQTPTQGVWPTPAGTPGGGNVISGGELPVIPPILPPSPVQPSTPVVPAQPAPAPVPPPPAPGPAPAPVAPRPPAVTNLPPDMLQKIQAAGEQIISSLIDPNTGGTWWLGSKGGVFNVGGAPFFGSARPFGFDDPNVRRAVQIVPLGRGYRVVSSRGENYDFPG